MVFGNNEFNDIEYCVLLYFSLVKLQRRIYGANSALQYFIRTHWTFKNHKFLKLHDSILPDDIDHFRFDNFVTYDVREYFLSCILGARRYLLNEKDENIPRAQRNYRRLVHSRHYINNFNLIFFKFLSEWL